MGKYENRRCIYCNKEYTPVVGNQKTCGGTECKKKLNYKLTMEAHFRKKGMKPKEKPKAKTVKNKSVCKRCKYYIEKHTYCDLNGTCDFENQTGRSRLKIELDNGGYRTDACVCYVAGNRRGRKVQPY